MSTIYTHSKMRTLFSGEVIRPHGQLWIQRENHAALAVCDSESAAPKYARGEQDRIGSGYNRSDVAFKKPTIYLIYFGNVADCLISG